MMSLVSTIARVTIVVAALAATGYHASHRAALRDARQAEARGDDLVAVRRALDHLDGNPWSREASRIAARGLSRLDFAGLAEPYYGRGGRLDLDDRHARALGLARANERARAIEAYQEILQERPDDVLALRRLGAILLSESRYDEMLEVARRLVEAPGGAVVGHTLAGISHHLKPDPDHELAVAAFDRARQLDPELAEIPLPVTVYWTYLSDALLKLGRADHALETLGRALARGDDASLLTMLGDAYHQRGRLDEAEDAWRRVVRIDPRSAPAWMKLGQLAMERGDPAGALDPLGRAAALTSTSYEPHYNLALAYRRLGRESEARHHQAIADRLRGQSPPKTTMGMLPGAEP